MKISEFYDASRSENCFTIHADRLDIANLGRDVRELAVRMAAEKLAERIVAEHGQEIISGCDMQAVSNLAVAEAATAIRETIHKKLPDVVHTRVERELYQRGVFGGVRRVS
jgi:hypothetical protein